MLARLSNFWQKMTGRRTTQVDSATGARGEQLAAEFLQQRRAMTVVTRNWRNPDDLRQEIDLVCRDKDVMVFVEVKARALEALVSGYHAVTPRKKRVLRQAVHAYLTGLSHPPRTFRFDVVEVALSDRLPPQVHHYENVPLFPKGYHVVRQSGSLDEVAS